MIGLGAVPTVSAPQGGGQRDGSLTGDGISQ